MFQKVTMNLLAAEKRMEVLNGRDYVVVPTVMLTEGVHNGTQGPLFYGKDQLAKNVTTWNHKPIVVYHPTLNGEGISACDPSVVQSHSVGMLFNTMSDGRLKTESWFDKEKTALVDPRVMAAINNNQMMEVSTGLFHDLDPTPGEWNGEKYVGSVQNILGDHLAVLPDQIGACSIVDGAGLLRNADGDTLSYSDIRDQLSRLLREQSKSLSVTTDDGSYVDNYTYVTDVYPKYAIYERGPSSYKIGYKVKSMKASLVGEPEEVRRVTTYVTANGETIGKGLLSSSSGGIISTGELDTANKGANVATPTVNAPPVVPTVNMIADIASLGGGVQSQTAEARNQLVSRAIAQLGASQKVWLESLPDELLGSIAGSVKVADVQPVVNSRVGAPLTANEYINQAPPELREVLHSALHTHNQAKVSMVKRIISNKANRFTEAWLMTQPINFLEGIAALAGTQPAVTANYGGQGDVQMFLPPTTPDPLTANADDEILHSPVMDFSRVG